MTSAKLAEGHGFLWVEVSVSQLHLLLQHFHTQLGQPLLSLYLRHDSNLQVVFATERSEVLLQSSKL